MPIFKKKTFCEIYRYNYKLAILSQIHDKFHTNITLKQEISVNARIKIAQNALQIIAWLTGSGYINIE